MLCFPDLFVSLRAKVFLSNLCWTSLCASSGRYCYGGICRGEGACVAELRQAVAEALEKFVVVKLYK
eukprot:3138226-Amphidinium_carterae.1